MKKAICIFIAVLLIAGTTACSGDDSNDPNLGLWKATSAEMLGMSMDVADFFDQGFTIELRANGRCTISVDGDKANGRWTLDNAAFTVKGGGVDCRGRLENGKLTLEDVMGSGVTLIFYKDGVVPADPTSRALETEAPPEVNETSVMQELPENLAWWDGDWYGYWTVVSADDPYSGFIGQVWDCYAIIDVNHDATAIITLFDDDISMGEIYVDLIDGHEGDIMGIATSTGGEMFGMPVKEEEIRINPEHRGHEDMIMIDQWHEDEDGDEFRYVIYLRKWGLDWDDYPEDERPPYYEDWYLGVKHMTMDEAIASINTSAGYGDGNINIDGLIGVEIGLTMSGREGMMYVEMPEGWFDHSMPDLMSGFMHISGSDDPWDDDYPYVQIRSSAKLADNLRDNLAHDGLMMGWTWDDRDWTGVSGENNGRDFVEVVTDIGEGRYVAIYAEGMDQNDAILKGIVSSFVVVWN